MKKVNFVVFFVRKDGSDNFFSCFLFVCLFVCLFVVVVFFDNLLLRLTSNFLAIFDSALEKGAKRVLEKAK